MPICETYGSDANSILESVMEANERPAEIKEMFKQFYSALDDTDYSAAKDILASQRDVLTTSQSKLRISTVMRLDFQLLISPLKK